MTAITLLTAATDQIEDGNYVRFANGLLNRGFEVQYGPMDSLRLLGTEVGAQVSPVKSHLKVGSIQGPFQTRTLTDQDIVWVLALGMRTSFLDKMQLLYSLPRRIRVINSLDTLMHLKSKYFMASAAEIQYPESWASNDPEELFDVMQRRGGSWIVKPPAGSFGRDVYRLTAEDTNCRVILETMTGYEDLQYCLLQRYVEEVSEGEKRILFAAGEPVGQYLRRATRDHRTNLMQGAEAETTELSADEKACCGRIGTLLKQLGADFVGVDLAYPWVIELNVVNPGGITTIEGLGGEDLSAIILDRIFPNSP